jgi:predicted Ser/Thr protein kinase
MADFPKIPGYTVHKLLGKGGMGMVYLGRQDGLNRVVALKITLATLGELDDTFVQRFVKEAHTTASLRHPNIIPVYDSGEFEGRCYMAMEYIDGGSLNDLLKIRRMSVDEVIDIGKGVCAALEHAHRAGFVHRDIKPENIMLNRDGQPVVTDFGIVKSMHGSTNLTGTNSTIGSPQYMSPEQLMGDDNIDGRADLYSLGVVLYEMLEGRPPFDDEQDYAVGMKHLTEKPPPLSPLHDRFQKVIDRLMQKNPDRRFSSAADVSRALEALRSHVVPSAIAATGAPSRSPRAPKRDSRDDRQPMVMAPKASLGRRLGGRFRFGRVLLVLSVAVMALVWMVWLKDVELRAINYEIQAAFGTPMDRFLVGRALFDRGEPERARFWMSRAMNDGYAGAAYELGRSYRYLDERRAVQYLQLELSNAVHDDNDLNAAMLLGHLLCNGGGAEDCRRAIEVLGEVVEKNDDPEAMYQIGEIYFSRVFPPQFDQALVWYQRAAEGRSSVAAGKAMQQIARIYDEGLGVDKQRKLATDWWVRAASLSSSTAQSRQSASKRCAEKNLRGSQCSSFEARP